MNNKAVPISLVVFLRQVYLRLFTIATLIGKSAEDASFVHVGSARERLCA